MSELSLDQAVRSDDYEQPLDRHDERRAFIDARLGELESGLADRIGQLENRLAASGYFADGPRKSHPLTERLSELESRLAFDVVLNGLSTKMRRLMAVGIFVAIAALAGSGVALAEDVHVNSVMAQHAADRNAQMERVIERIQAANAGIRHNTLAREAETEKIMRQVEGLDARIKRNNDTRDAQIESLMDAIQGSDAKIRQALRASETTGPAR